ncbi:MAG TPA: aspartate ammonia-lyase [Oceanospirillales bacterium]|nr:aspartate ammonia-lyase [Oceanospirillaceae bacterium]HBS42133.1 aspartate ammonia-lyase [Oceanospirillales bacterium]
MVPTRTETDSMGDLQVPADALYAAQTQRAVENFPVSGERLPEAFIRALIRLKKAAAEANQQLEQIPASTAEAIIGAADQLLAETGLMQHFPVDVFQTGSGTSTNMNANEVLATLATRTLGDRVSANDHVNAGQSSNDVIPSVIHISTALEIRYTLLPALTHLATTIRRKADDVKAHVKTGRTHLMDAMPVRLSQSLGAWATQTDENIERLEQLLPGLEALALGGTAVGTGVNAHPGFAALCCQLLNDATGMNFRPADDLFSRIAAQDTAVAVSGALKTQAVTIMKIANDLRWMNSGPLAGLGEIELQALQPGSSIMPGKVNPVIPEAAAMVAARVMGNDTTITVAGQSGNFELNVMLPLMAHNLLQSIRLLGNVSELLADKAIATFTVKDDKLQEALAKNPVLVTALNPEIGYLKAADIAKKAYREGRPIIDVAEEETGLPRSELEQLLDPVTLTGGKG